MLNLRSCATFCYEPCQGWKTAALSRCKRVPQGSFRGVLFSKLYYLSPIKKDCTVFYGKK